MLDSKRRIPIVFYGYSPVNCDYSKYIAMREIISNGYKVINSTGKRCLVELSKRYSVSCDDETLKVLMEPLERNYHVFNYLDKTILDIGGFQGETSVLFASWGARKIVVS
jgi:hypothetical protein